MASATVPAGGSHWEVVDGLLTGCGKPAGYLTSDGSYKNFVLSLEFRCSEDTNSGVYVRAPKEAGGYEVQIWKQQPAGYNTGSIVGTAKTERNYSIKPDQWNHFQITADGDHIVVVLNGETTLDIRDTRFPEGNIRFSTRCTRLPSGTSRSGRCLSFEFRPEEVDVERLGQEIIHAGLDASFTIGGPRIRRHGNQPRS